MEIRVKRFRSGKALKALVFIDGYTRIGFDSQNKHWFFKVSADSEWQYFPKLKAALAAWRLMR